MRYVRFSHGLDNNESAIIMFHAWDTVVSRSQICRVGNTSSMTVPPPSRGIAAMEPPCMVTSFLVTLRPIPVPFAFPEVEERFEDALEVVFFYAFSVVLEVNNEPVLLHEAVYLYCAVLLNCID